MTAPTPTPTRGDLPLRPSALWAGLAAATFAAAMALAYRPDLSTGEGIPMAILPWVLLGLGTLTVARVPIPVRATALAGVLVIWAALLLNDDTWSVLNFAVYLLCFTFDARRQLVGIVLSGLATATWIGAWSMSDNPLWVVLLPGIVFVAAATLSVAMHRTASMAEEQAALAAQLRATRHELAASERSRGILEERTRMAGEIHDTLAQGFTSIVLLARGAQRTTGPDETLASIEDAAKTYLAEARRIVRSAQPLELEGQSLHDALATHVQDTLAPPTTSSFHLTGSPLPLTGDVEVVLLRAAQETLRNIDMHAGADHVHVTLSYLGDTVVLDVSDDGVGFEPGAVHDRGALTGGQGLAMLARRAEALGGTLQVESTAGRGTTVSLHLPVETS